MMAYAPKATVQAAIGGIPLALGEVPVASTDEAYRGCVPWPDRAGGLPLGAFAMDLSCDKRLLKGMT